MNYDDFTLVELRVMAKDKGATNVSKLKREELIEYLKSHEDVESNEVQEENEDDNVKLNYHTSDHQSYPLFYQAYHFDGSPIKLGYWYINPRYVRVK